MSAIKLYYVYDGLCYWSYAFHNQLLIVLEDFPDFPLYIISGGMYMPSDNIRALDVIPTEYMNEKFEDVQKLGDVQISDKFLTNLVLEQNFHLNSEIPAKALCTFKHFKKDVNQELLYIHEQQKLIFSLGINPNTQEYLTYNLPEFGIEEFDFLHEYFLPKIENYMEKDFEEATLLCVNSYPRLLLETAPNNFYNVAVGFTPAQIVIKNIYFVLQSYQS